MNSKDPLSDAVSPIVPTRVYAQIVEKICDLIADGTLKPGDKLPPERELAERFHVSRNSVRTALHTLEVFSLTESRQGDGTYVRHNNIRTLPDNQFLALVSKRESIKEILGARKILEPGVAYAAAQNASPEDIQELEEILYRHEVKASYNDPGAEEDQHFHFVIARMAKNRIVLDITEMFNDVIFESRELLLVYKNSSMRSGHRNILAGLKAKDPNATSLAMLKHIEEVESAYKEIFTELNNGNVNR